MRLSEFAGANCLFPETFLCLCVPSGSVVKMFASRDKERYPAIPCVVVRCPGNVPGRERSMPEYVDVLIVGAGISGIAAAYYLGERCPHLSWTIVEGRAAIGGTWDFFATPASAPIPTCTPSVIAFGPGRARRRSPTVAAILQYLKRHRARIRHRRAHPVWASRLSH